LAAFEVDDIVDVAISFLTINTNPEFASDPSVDNTTMPDNAFVSTKTVFTDAKILVMGGIRDQTDPRLISIALKPEDANLLTLILSAHMPIAISIMHSDVPALAIEYRSDGRISVEVPVTSLNTDEGGPQTSDRANILARMNFTNYDPDHPDMLEPKTLVSQIIVRNAEMVDSLGTLNQGDVMRVRLIISPDELPVLEWALKANLPLALQFRPE
jgi:hypothetical protein